MRLWWYNWISATALNKTEHLRLGTPAYETRWSLLVGFVVFSLNNWQVQPINTKWNLASSQTPATLPTSRAASRPPTGAAAGPRRHMAARRSTPLFPPAREEARRRARQHRCRFSLCRVCIDFLVGHKGLFTDSGTSSRERTAKGQASSCDSYLFWVGFLFDSGRILQLKFGQIQFSRYSKLNILWYMLSSLKITKQNHNKSKTHRTSGCNLPSKRGFRRF